jgi:hypothetical protein
MLLIEFAGIGFTSYRKRPDAAKGDQRSPDAMD